MPTNHDLFDDAVTSAVKSAVLLGDPTCPAKNVWTYRRNPLQLTNEKMFAIFGTGSGDSKIYHGWDMTKLNSPEEIETAESGTDTILTSWEVWTLRGFYSLLDELASEVTFRKIVANVQYQLRQCQAVTKLIDYGVDLERASLNQFNIATLTGTELVHYAELSLTFRHEDHQ